VEHDGSPDLTKAAQRLLAFVRVMVGLACVVVQLRVPSSSHWLVTGAAVVFAIYGLAALIIQWRKPTGWSLLAFVAETIFFLLFAVFGSDVAGWAGSALYTYLLLSALLLRPWWDTWVIAVTSGILVALLAGSHDVYLLPVVTWSGLLACLCALYKSRSEGDSSLLVQHFREEAEHTRQARDADRNKLAGDFHDGPLQTFISVQMRLEILRKLLERSPQAAAEELRELQQISKSQITELRGFLRGIRPVEVGEGGLVSSLRRAVADFQKHTGITATFQSGDSPDPLPSPEAAAEIVQIVREALNNVHKHSRATRVAVAVNRVGKSIEVSAEDNGIGFPFSGSFNLDEQELLRIGPFSIQKRVRNLKGELIVESRPERGAGLKVRITA
jgi:signal transduction histidine kinase